MTGPGFEGNPAFRRYWLGHCTSVLGTNMREFTMLWLVNELTGSVTWLAAVPLARVVSMLACTVPAGTLADRLPRRQVILMAETGSLAVSIMLAVGAFSSTLAPWFVVLSAALLGALHAFEAPARNVLVHDLVSGEGLLRALSLMSVAPGVGRIVGYMAGGLLYAQVGPGLCFLLDSLSYVVLLAVVAGLPKGRAASADGSRSAAADALRHVWSDPRMRRLFVVLFIVTVIGGAYRPLMAAIASRLLSMEVTEFGLLQATAAIGSLIAALLLGKGIIKAAAQHVLKLAGFLLPLGLLALSFASGALSAIPAVLVLAGLLTAAEASANASLQRQAPEAMRGRVVAFYTILVHLFPLGGWVLAMAAEAAGLRAVLVGLAVFVLAAMAGVSLREASEPVTQSADGDGEP